MTHMVMLHETDRQQNWSTEYWAVLLCSLPRNLVEHPFPDSGVVSDPGEQNSAWNVSLLGKGQLFSVQWWGDTLVLPIRSR